MPRPSDDFVNEVVLFRAPGQGRDDGSGRAPRGRAARGGARGDRPDLQGHDHVYSSNDAGLVSPDRDATVITIGMGHDAEDGIKDVIDVVERADAGPTRWRSRASSPRTTTCSTLSNKDLKEGELFFGLPAALIVLLLVFGAVVASFVPLLLAIVSIVFALALVAVVGQVWEVSFFIVNMLSGMGLALGVDYALFIVSRFREERARGVEKLDAIASDRADREPRGALQRHGVRDRAQRDAARAGHDPAQPCAGAVLVGMTTVAAAMTLLPAVLSLLGDRVDALRLPFLGRGRRGGPFLERGRRARAAAPGVSLVVSVAILVALALPALDLRTGSAGVRTIPDGYASKDGFNALEREFGVGTVDTARGRRRGRRRDEPRRARGSSDLVELLSNDDAFRAPEASTVGPDGKLAIVEAQRPRRQPRRSGGAGDRACSAPRSCRRRWPAPDAATSYVTGETAEIVDYREMMESWLPIVFLFVLGFSFVLLTLAFRSLVVPAKAIVLNLLSVGAAYGLIVLVFQKGVGNELFGFPQVDAIEAWLPLFLFSVLFGLSMDYHVFLLSRIRERYTQTGDTSEAVAFGVRTTARLITGAALIIVVVFVGFATGDS